jgi:hypothetical protein
MRTFDDDAELEALIEKIGVVSPRVAGRIDHIGQTRVHQLMDSGEYENFRDGASRKITLRSIMERRMRLLAAAAAADPVRRQPVPKAKPQPMPPPVTEPQSQAEPASHSAAPRRRQPRHDGASPVTTEATT